jgi:hypothetical protein
LLRLFKQTVNEDMIKHLNENQIIINNYTSSGSLINTENGNQTISIGVELPLAKERILNDDDVNFGDNQETIEVAVTEDDENAAEEDADDDPDEYEFIDINAEVSKSLDEIDKLQFQEPIVQQNDPDIITENVIFNEQDEYDAELGDPLYDLTIRLGTDELPRFSCACHKANIAVRMAIKKSTTVCSLLAVLSNFAGSTRRSINDSQAHIVEKSRLRVENATRWSSSYLMLESFKKCFDKNIFDGEYKPPFSQQKIELYLQILLPAYRLSTILQSTKSSIGDVIPLLLILIDTWKRMSLTGASKQFRDYLVKAFEHKFSYELDSNVYLSAAVLEASGLVCWFREDFSEQKVLLLNDALNICSLDLAKKEAGLNLKQNNNQEDDSDSDDDGGNLMKRMGIRRANPKPSQTTNALNQQLILRKIEKEVNEYLSYINEANIKKIKCSSTFWSENIDKYHYLGMLARDLLNVPASTAFVERFFSLCGVICNQRAANMSNDLIVMRCMLKSNISILSDDTL